jgi:hypothetical protein
MIHSAKMIAMLEKAQGFSGSGEHRLPACSSRQLAAKLVANCERVVRWFGKLPNAAG